MLFPTSTSSDGSAKALRFFSLMTRTILDQLLLEDRYFGREDVTEEGFNRALAPCRVRTAACVTVFKSCSDESLPMHRRELLTAAATVTASAVAGCLGSERTAPDGST